MIDSFVSRAVLTPFVSNGRSWEGWDCYGLVWVAHKEILGIELPKRDDAYEDVKQLRRLARLLGAGKSMPYWQQIEESQVQPMDVVVMKMRNITCHVGLVLDKGTMVHAEQAIGTAVESWLGASWRGPGYDKVEGFYRYQCPGGATSPQD